MAAPIIDSIDAPASVQPGAAFVVTIVAHDPDEAVGVLTGRVADSAGETDQQDATVLVMDTLNYSLLDTSGLGFVITPRPGEPPPGSVSRSEAGDAAAGPCQAAPAGLAA